MKKLICTLLLAASALQFASAADVSTEAAPAETEPNAAAESPNASAPPAPPPAIEIKNKSSFALQENARNPFWPIGWRPVPKQPGGATEPAGPQVLPNAFVVSSIVMDPRARFAIINGKVMNEGQVFGLQMGSSTYQITVKAIEDGRVILVRGRDQEIIVPLRRR